MIDHAIHSSYREKLVEHLFIGEILKCSWKDGHLSVEVSKPEVDRKGYDLIFERGKVIRHVQLKASRVGARVAQQKVHLALAEKPSGCIIWIEFNEDSMSLGPYRFFGAKAGDPLPDISGFRVAKHVKANSQGIKTERPEIRVVPKGEFELCDSIEALYRKLFSNAGPETPSPA